jgi:hypothetical protein
LKLASEVGRAFQPDKMAASVADPDSFGHREMTALLSFILIKLRPPQSDADKKENVIMKKTEGIGKAWQIYREKSCESGDCR